MKIIIITTTTTKDNGVLRFSPIPRRRRNGNWPKKKTGTLFELFPDGV
jgi:hypothetical protein